MTAVRRGAKPLAVLLLLLIVWEWATRAFSIEAWLLPAPSSILREAVTGYPAYIGHLGSTVALASSGFAIGAASGLLLAIMLFRLPAVREALYPLLILSQNVPIIVLAPLLVIWFGFGAAPKLIVIFLVCFFPITVAALDGFRQTDSELVHYMRMAGASPRQLFWKLQWPFALPSIFSGLKIAITYSVMGAVISEWLGAQKGIGVYMTLASASFRTPRVFVAILLIMALSLLAVGFISLLERSLLTWRAAEKGETDG